MTESRNARRLLTGTVTTAKGAKTISVAVDRTYKHPKYGKYMRKRKKYMAHDENNEAAMGDTVEITSTRPLSKLKRWRLVRVVEKAVLQ